MLARRPAFLVGLAAAFAAALAVRAAQLHDALLYPDGYQYLLMARGIAAHGRPLVRLGPGGDLFVPNADASLKPLFPALVALGHLLGLAVLEAARAITALAGAATVVLCGLVARRLTGAWTSGLAAGALCLASPTLAYWGGFVGPDSLAPALALASALALLDRRLVVGGILVAGCVATRPEYLALAIAAAVAAAMEPRARPALVRVTTSASFTMAALLAAVRPPLELPDPRLVVGGVLGAVVVGVLAATARRQAVPAWAWPTAAAVAAAALAVAGIPAGLRELGASDWPLLVAAGVGFAAAVAGRRSREPAVALALAVALLAAAYVTKNPDLERYDAQLVPLLAVLAGLAATRLRSAMLVAPAAAALLVLAPIRAEPGMDAFAATAPALERTSGTIVTAAPDAYGELLYPRAVRALRRGRNGLVVLDAAQRLLEPHARAAGRVVARVPSGDGLMHPDGSVDRKPTLLVRGVVERRG